MRLIKGRGLPDLSPISAPHRHDVEEQLFFFGGPLGNTEAMGFPIEPYRPEGRTGVGAYIIGYQSDGPIAFTAYDWDPDA